MGVSLHSPLQGGEGEILHRTSDSHFNRRNWLFFQNFPHAFAVICQGLSYHLSDLQHDTGSFSLPCLRQHPDPRCHSVALPNGFSWFVMHSPNRAWLLLSAEGLGHLLPPLPHPAEAMLPSGWFLGGCLCWGQGWAAVAPAGAGVGLRQLPGVLRRQPWCGAQPPVPALPRGPAGPHLLKNWEEKKKINEHCAVKTDSGGACAILK